MVRALILLAALLFPSAQDDLSPEMRQLVNQLIRLQRSWGPAMSTHSAAVTLKQDKPIAGDGALGPQGNFSVVPYLIYTTGLPNDKIYRLTEVNFPDLNPKVAMEGIGLNSEGLAVCPGKPGTCRSEEGPDDPIDLILPSAKGQVHHMALISEDQEDRAFFVVIPFPARSTDKGCTLELQRVLPKGELVYLTLSGLPPNSDVKLDSASLGEKHSGSVKSDSLGNYTSALMPAVMGKDHGTLRVTASTSGCSPSASIGWGTGSDRYE